MSIETSYTVAAERLLDIHAWPDEPNNCYRCLDCGFVLDGVREAANAGAQYPDDSFHFRAGEHARCTGHRVGRYIDWPWTSDPYEIVEAQS